MSTNSAPAGSAVRQSQELTCDASFRNEGRIGLYLSL